MADASASDSHADGSQAGEQLDAIGLVQQLAPSVPRSQLETVLYPENGLRKAELIAYYTTVADWMLPHVAKRPLELLRCPEGRRKNCHLQRHLTADAPPAIGRVTIREAQGEAVYGFVEDLAGLVALAQFGAVQIQTWGCHAGEIEKPDLLVFGATPDPELAFARVSEAALALREQLAVLGLESFVMTNGDGGLYVVAPVAPKHGWDAHKAFAQGVVGAMAKAEPERYATRGRKPHKGMILLDAAPSARGASTIAPYSPVVARAQNRALPGARKRAHSAREGTLVATPLGWEELEHGVQPEQFDLRGVIHKLEGNASDPWQGFWELFQALPSDSLQRRLAVV